MWPWVFMNDRLRIVTRMGDLDFSHWTKRPRRPIYIIETHPYSLTRDSVAVRLLTAAARLTDLESCLNYSPAIRRRESRRERARYSPINDAGTNRHAWRDFNDLDCDPAPQLCCEGHRPGKFSGLRSRRA
jgi:hypothetical protein